MSPGSTRFSYKDRKSNKLQRLRVFLILLLILSLYLVFTQYLLATLTVKSQSMNPSIEKGDTLFFHPSSKGDNLERGDLLLFEPPYYRKNTYMVRFTNLLLRIISFQKLEISSYERPNWEKELMIKRVIALPGDSLYIEDFVVYVKPAGEEFFLSEFETSGIDYDILTPQDISDQTRVLTGEMDEMVLNPGEYFVMGDNRRISSDSSTWGVLPENRIRGKILFRYWPLRHAGRI